MSARKLSIAVLDATHKDVLIRAICRILSTELAELTFAQIVDGLPLENVMREGEPGRLPSEHPFWGSHHHLCPGVLEKIKEFRANFDATMLDFTAEVGERLWCTALKLQCN